MLSRPILVAGATGKTGSRIVARLEARNHSVLGGSRGASMSFEWERPYTWGTVLEGAGAAYICCYPDLAFPGAHLVVRHVTPLSSP